MGPGPPSTTRIASINVAGKDHAFEGLQITCDILALQEARFDLADTSSFQAAALNRGYAAFAVATCRGRHGGAAILVTRSRQSRLLEAYSSVVADAVRLVTRQEECSEEEAQHCVDEAWRRLENAVEETMWRVLCGIAAHHRGEPEWEAARRRRREAAKGCAEVTACSPLRGRGQAEDSFALRGARNVLSMADAYIQAPADSVEKANLLGKLRRRGVTGRIAEQRRGLALQVEAEELRLRRGRIAAWKEKMRDFRAASAYLRGPS